ncbi:anthrone oxygenase family protein [Streptomyces chrestomyceticus]|uniref:anthrone oxygenase family protein n=1 Tax=Streptomyces chrestomyceticus TaxID=68185 RepID=UPI0019D15993|nr:anthrone oxygenase family protein [Streptomyces chrestomyceticus]
MYDTIRTATLFAATVTTGLIAGLFFAFSCAVLPGLHAAGDRTFVSTMQHVNTAILNGWFALAFMGAPLLTVATAALHLRADVRAALPWLVAALALYGVALAVTFSLSVPLNNALASVGEASGLTGTELAAARALFEAPWTRWNLVRTLTTTAALGCLLRGLVLHGRLTGKGA